MNSMNDEPFFDLAMKVIAGQCTDAERAELDALLAREPKLRAEFARLQADVRVAEDALRRWARDAEHGPKVWQEAVRPDRHHDDRVATGSLPAATSLERPERQRHAVLGHLRPGRSQSRRERG